MQKNNKLEDYDLVFEAKFGAKGTASREKAEEVALAFYDDRVVASTPSPVQDEGACIKT